ncbi:MAG: transposase [Thermomicrobiales bacterium]
MSDGQMQLNQAGEMVNAAWRRLPDRFQSIELDAFVVMPNHFHGILFLGVDPEIDPPSLSRVIQVFKSQTAVEYGRGIREGALPPVRRALWHRSFHDRIIRDERILGLAREYVADNPLNWHEAHAR